MRDIKVFRMDDYVWMVGVNLESCIAAYLADTGMERDELDDPRELTDEEMDKFKFYDDTPFEGDGSQRSFREQLARVKAEGGDFPRIFASTEY